MWQKQKTNKNITKKRAITKNQGKLNWAVSQLKANLVTPKLSIGPIQPSSNLIGPKPSQANFNQVPVNQSESESE